MNQRAFLTGGEKESLHGSLNRHRDVILWKLEGLDDEQLRRPMTPSGTNLLGLVKHLANVEYQWFCETFGRHSEAIPVAVLLANPEADMRADPDESTADIVDFYGRARTAADSAIDELDLDHLGTAWSGETVSMRRPFWRLVQRIAAQVSKTA
jgi:hypothetical protein